VEATSATFKDRPAYYVQEVHIELVLENKVIEGIMDWVDGGEPIGLTRDVKKVVLDDSPLRGAMPVPHAVADPDLTVKRLSANEKLSRADIQALFGSSVPRE
jgi:hypothetical protein